MKSWLITFLTFICLNILASTQNTDLFGLNNYLHATLLPNSSGLLQAKDRRANIMPNSEVKTEENENIKMCKSLKPTNLLPQFSSYFTDSLKSTDEVIKKEVLSNDSNSEDHFSLEDLAQIKKA